jgi:uncharacterized protein YdeI (YjbR/CyaY-like superfamily)
VVNIKQIFGKNWYNLSMAKNPKVDQYIDNAEEFAQPILKHLRELIHQACPEVEEVIKWGMPAFEYKGPLCSMAAFKRHAVFGLWKESLIPGMKEYIREQEAMGSWGRITSLKGLPPDQDIIKFIKVAMELNEKGVNIKRPAAAKKSVQVKVPDYFVQVLSKNKQAEEHFSNSSPSFRKEYIEWLEGAKTEETRDRRVAQALEWISKGKGRNWKYER